MRKSEECPAGCVWPPSLLNCVWPGRWFTSAVWEPLAPLTSEIIWLKLWLQTMGVGPHFLLGCHVGHRSISETDEPLSSSKSSNQSWWECLLFTCKLDLDEGITCAEKPVCSFTVFGSASVQSFNLMSCILQDDFPVQPMGQIQGAVQPSQQHLQQPGPAGYPPPSEEVPLALHTQSKWQ